MLKRLLRLVIVLVLLLVIAAVLIIINLNRFVRAGVERGGSAALGVSTTLEKASVSILDGTVGLDGLRLGSPEGFSAAEMFKLDHAYARVDVLSLRTDEIVVHEVIIDGPEIILEFAGARTNWGVLLKRLKEETSEEGVEEKEATEQKAARKRIRVDRIVFKNGKISIAGIPLVGTLGVPLPQVEIRDLGTREGGGLTAKQVLVAVVAGLYRSILGVARVVLAAAGPEAMGDALGSMLKEAGGILGDVGLGAGETVKGAAETVKGAAEEVKDVLEGILYACPILEHGMHISLLSPLNAQRVTHILEPPIHVASQLVTLP